MRKNFNGFWSVYDDGKNELRGKNAKIIFNGSDLLPNGESTGRACRLMTGENGYIEYVKSPSRVDPETNDAAKGFFIGNVSVEIDA